MSLSKNTRVQQYLLRHLSLFTNTTLTTLSDPGYWPNFHRRGGKFPPSARPRHQLQRYLEKKKYFLKPRRQLYCISWNLDERLINWSTKLFDGDESKSYPVIKCPEARTFKSEGSLDKDKREPDSCQQSMEFFVHYSFEVMFGWFYDLLQNSTTVEWELQWKIVQFDYRVNIFFFLEFDIRWHYQNKRVYKFNVSNLQRRFLPTKTRIHSKIQ